MSDQATDIVLNALTRMKAVRPRTRAPLDALARLQSTAGAHTHSAEAAPTQNPSSRSSVDSSPPVEPRKNSAPKIEFPTTTPVIAPPVKAAPVAANGSKADKLAAFRDPVLACTRCPNLVNARTQVVFGVGNPDAELMFVGEAPGADEDLVGEPFVGKAGQLLTRIIETMGFRRSDVYIANILKCRPDMPAGSSGNRKPTPAEMETCKPYLLEQIEIIRPRVLVALGATAVEGLFGGTAAIMKTRGTWREFRGIPLMPTFHPAYLLRNQAMSEKRKVWEDMLAVLEHLGREITPKQRGFFLSKSG